MTPSDTDVDRPFSVDEAATAAVPTPMTAGAHPENRSPDTSSIAMATPILAAVEGAGFIWLAGAESMLAFPGLWLERRDVKPMCRLPNRRSSPALHRLALIAPPGVPKVVERRRLSKGKARYPDQVDAEIKFR